jgi:hypothetical protein
MRPRFHARFPGAACEGLDGLGAGARLAAYRIEPVRSVDGPQHYLDLTFVEGEHVAVVGAIRIDRHALAHRDQSPFVAPREALAILEALERACDALEPRLRDIFAAAIEPHERLYRIAGVGEPTVAARRAVRAFGAVRYARAAHARGRSVGDDAYVETCLGDVPPDPNRAAPLSFGAAAAALRCYVALSDSALASGGGAYRTALAIGTALGGDEVRVDVGGYDGRPLDPYAFVHAVGLDDPEAAVELIGAAHPRGIRTLLTPLFDDPCNGGYWGARAHVRTLRIGDDEELLGRFLATLVARKLVLDDDVRPDVPWEPSTGFRDAQRTALSFADGVLVACAAEALRIRSACGADRAFGAYVPLPQPLPLRDAAAAPYVLAVAPVGPLHASATLARAAARAGLPLRFAGAVQDGAYAARARSYLDDRSSFAPGDPGRGVRVVADVSWSGADLGALASHAAHGVPVVGSNRCDVRDVFGTSGVWAVDPADEVAIAQALCEAWNGAAAVAAPLAEHTRARCRVDVLRACLTTAYNAPQLVS